MEIERRQHPRIKYPDDRRPELLIRYKDGKEVRKGGVVDISEKGIGLISNELSGLQPKSKLQAQIMFSDRKLLYVEGEVMRVSENRAGIYLSNVIPYSRIMKEQELLRN